MRAYRFHGVHVGVALLEPAAGAARVLAYHGLRPAEPGDAPPVWTLDLAAPRPPVPYGAVRVASHEAGLTVWADGGALVLDAPGGALRVDPAAGTTTGALPTAEPDRVTPERYALLTFALLALLDGAGRYPLHAAGLVAPGGEGVLLVGPSDAGKSTMTLHLVRQGWAFLTDDSVLLHRTADGAVEAAPFRRDFGLDPDAADLFPELAGTAAAQPTDAAKWLVDGDALYPARRAEACRPALLVFPRIAPGAPASTLTPLRPHEALLGLIPQASFFHADAARTAAPLGVLRTLAGQARAVRFDAGADVHRDGARLAAYLAGELAHPA